MSKVKCLYDFTAESANEVSTFVGETLAVLDPNSYEGWLKIRNNRGEEGIVPSAYVEFVDDDDDDIPPPPSSSAYPVPTTDSWGNNSFNQQTAYVNTQPAYDNQNTYNNSYTNQDYSNTIENLDELQFDSGLTDLAGSNTNDPLADFEQLATSYIELISPPLEEETSQPEPELESIPWKDNRISIMSVGSYTTPQAEPAQKLGQVESIPEIPNQPPVGEVANSSWDTPAIAIPTYNPPVTQINTKPPVTSHYSDSDFDEDDQPSHASKVIGREQNNGSFKERSNSTMTPATSSLALAKHKTKNSFGLDVFLLLGNVKSVPDSDRLSTIVLNDHRLSLWKRRCPPYSISIINHIIDKKYHGIKSFVSYEIQTEKFPQRVRRRYNQFDWLHERLDEKYPNICIPPLPDKALKGNFEEDFIMQRKAKLELWLNRLSSHPVINESEVFIHFLQCDESSAKWKAGKRKAEKDDYRGAQWFSTLTVPGESSDTIVSIKERVEKFSKAATVLDYSVKNVCSALEKVSAMHQSAYRKEMNTLGKRFEELGTVLSNESLEAQNNAILSRALVTCGNTYVQIGNSYNEQHKEDVNPLLDRLYLYRGIVQQMPDIVQFEKNAIGTYEEFQQKPEKLQGRNLMEVASRREIISHVTFAEINQFNKDKVEDITICMKTFLKKQIEFYSEITECLKRSLAGFEQIPVTKKF